MRRRQLWPVALGVLLAAVYVSVAVLAGRTGPLSRRPLLDGFGRVAPYNWASPPPSLAATNKAPASGRFDVALDPQTGSQATVLSTSDSQASLALDDGSIAPMAGQDSARLTITPLAPGGFGAARGGLLISGNVYRIQAQYRPSGEEIARLAKPAQVVLFYPAEAGSLLHQHKLLVSSDGRVWSAVIVTDSTAQQLIQGTISSFGYFAVGRAAGGTPKGGAGIGTILVYVFVGLAILGIALMILRTEVRLRRERRRKRGKRGGRAGRGGSDDRTRRDRRDPFRR